MKKKRLQVVASGVLTLAATAGGIGMIGLSGVASASSGSSTTTQLSTPVQGVSTDQGGNVDVQVGDQSGIDSTSVVGSESTSTETASAQVEGTGTEVASSLEADGPGGHQDPNGVDVRFGSQL